MRRKIKAGTLGDIVDIIADDTSSSTGGRLDDLEYNSAGLAAKYKRSGDSAWTAITLAHATVGEWTSGGFINSGSGSGGKYEFHTPNAVIAAGVTHAVIEIYGAENMAPVEIEYELDAVDYQTPTSFGQSPTGIRDAMKLAPSAGEPDAGSIDAELMANRDLLEADRYIDTSPTPWQLVLVKKGTGALGVGTELLRQDLFDEAGDDIETINDFIGQQVSP